MESDKTWNIPEIPPSGPALGPELQRRVLQLLQTRLPSGWYAEPAPFSRSATGLDGKLDIRTPPPNAQRTLVWIEAKTRVEPKDVPSLVAQARNLVRTNEPLILGAPFLSPRTRELLVQAGVGYADLTGNLRIASKRPPLFIELSGSDSDPWPDTRPLRSLKGGSAGRVVRALCDFRPPYGVQELARRSETAAGTVSRVVNFLENEALLTRGPRGGVEDVRWPDLLRRWTQDYAFMGSNQVASYLEPRGLPALEAKLRETSQRYALTGSLAASRLAPLAPPRLATLFAEDPDRLVHELGLRPAETGANVLVALPFDDVVFDRTQRQAELVYVSPSQAVADLLTGPGRSPSEAEALITWMREHEDAWRA